MKNSLLRMVFPVAVLLLTAGCGRPHFISDESFRREVDSVLNARAETFGPAWESLYAPEGKLTAEEKEALDFLYAYMPTADITDYPTVLHLENVRAAFRARKEMGWNVPEEIFRHFVLPVRVNNESLDSARTVFYQELAPRVKGLSMADAILEVNHWCHEKVTYHPSDGRTSSPLNTVNNTEGRCGEESVVTVTALRSVGIPARQVYTPRWAHTDDNHAWVEAWADGKWHFLGACEPEPVLDLGWFNAPASRCMFTHTKVFGEYHGPEEVVLRGPNYTEINLIGNYAKTAGARIRVLGPDGNPVEGARVDFCIYNYAEFYPAVSRFTDAKGLTSISSGLGDLLVWASKDGLYGWAKVSFGLDSEVVVHLAETPSPTREDLEIVPPPEKARFPEVTPEQREENSRRLAREDSVRTAWAGTFLTPEAAGALAAGYGYGHHMAHPLVQSKGNHETLRAFMEKAADHERVETILSGLSRKDLRDVTPDVLWDDYNHALNPESTPQRVSNEFLTPYREALTAVSGGRFSGADGPEKILAWIRDSVRIDRTPGRWNITQSPLGVWKGRITDPHSRDIFFVSLARTFGTAALIDPVTGKVRYRNGDAWTDVDFDGAATVPESPKGTLRLRFKSEGRVINPGYYTHFTISKITEGRPRLLTFDEGEVDMGGGTDWAGSFKNGVRLDTGEYILVSGARREDGSVPAVLQYFTIKEGAVTDVDLTVKEDSGALPIIGRLRSEVAEALAGDFKDKDFAIFGCITPGEEPTVHALNDLVAAREELEAWGGTIELITVQAGVQRLIGSLAGGKFKGLPSNITLAGDDGEGLLINLEETFKVGRGAAGGVTRKPYFVIMDREGAVYFLSEGYTIGLGDRLAAALKRLP
ncbi:MAG: transglutaminase domain-containing protein [Bacteroidales bacterium]|nr:transglutaminase domain-containing protein [Bacteroidales bacterium]